MDIHRKKTIPAEANQTAQRRLFVAVQACKAAIGAVLSFAFIGFVGRPDAAEAIAFAGLVAPAALALLAFTSISLAALETAALAIFAALIGYLAALTGGMVSPLVVWFALVPAEAALAGGRPAVLRAALASCVALAAVAGIEAAGALPASRLPMPAWEIYALSIFAAIVQAALIAAASQDRQRVADKAAADGAAMYRFLADNAMDLITRHSSDGRIRFASPAALPLLGQEPESLIGLAPSALVHPDDLQTMQAAFMEASYFGRPASAELRLKRAGDTHVWAEIRCRPVPKANGEAADIVVKERRATFAATPQQDAKRPGARTALSNLILAGDWTRTGLPATIEGALRSGETAAKLLLQAGF